MTYVIAQPCVDVKDKSCIEGEYIPAGTSERVFGTLAAMTDYIRVFNVESARYGTGYLDGRKIWVLQYQPNI